MSTSSDTVTSPCIAVCVIDSESGFCKGCFRTMEEIGRWMLVDNDGRREIVEASEARRSAAGRPKPKARPFPG